MSHHPPTGVLTRVGSTSHKKKQQQQHPHKYRIYEYKWLAKIRPYERYNIPASKCLIVQNPQITLWSFFMAVKFRTNWFHHASTLPVTNHALILLVEHHIPSHEGWDFPTLSILLMVEHHKSPIYKSLMNPHKSATVSGWLRNPAPVDPVV